MSVGTIIDMTVSNIFGREFCLALKSCAGPCLIKDGFCVPVLFDALDLRSVVNMSWEFIEAKCYRRDTIYCTDGKLNGKAIKFVTELLAQGNSWDVHDNYFISQKICDNQPDESRCIIWSGIAIAKSRNTNLFCSAFLKNTCDKISKFCTYKSDKCVSVDSMPVIGQVDFDDSDLLNSETEGYAFCSALSSNECEIVQICRLIKNPYRLNTGFICLLKEKQKNIVDILGQSLCADKCLPNICVKTENAVCNSIFLNSMELHDSSVSWDDLFNKCITQDSRYCKNSNVNHGMTVSYIYDVIKYGNLKLSVRNSYYISQLICNYRFYDDRCIRYKNKNIVKSIPSSYDFCSALLRESCLILSEFCYLNVTQCDNKKGSKPMIKSRFFASLDESMTMTEREAFCISLPLEDCNTIVFCTPVSYESSYSNFICIPAYRLTLPSYIFGMDYCLQVINCQSLLCVYDKNVCVSKFLNSLEITDKYITYGEIEEKCLKYFNSEYCKEGKLDNVKTMVFVKKLLNDGNEWSIDSNYFISQKFCESYESNERCINYLSEYFIASSPSASHFCSALLQNSCREIPAFCDIVKGHCYNVNKLRVFRKDKFRDLSKVITPTEKKAFCAALEETDCDKTSLCEPVAYRNVNKDFICIPRMTVKLIVDIFGREFCKKKCNKNLCVMKEDVCKSIFLDSLDILDDNVSWENIRSKCSGSQSVYCQNNLVLDEKLSMQFVDDLLSNGNYWDIDSNYFISQMLCEYYGMSNRCFIWRYMGIIKFRPKQPNFCSALLKASCMLFNAYCKYEEERCIDLKNPSEITTVANYNLNIIDSNERKALCAALPKDKCGIFPNCVYIYENVGEQFCTDIIYKRLDSIFGKRFCLSNCQPEFCITVNGICYSKFIQELGFANESLSWKKIIDKCVTSTSLFCFKGNFSFEKSMEFVNSLLIAGNIWNIQSNYYISQNICEHHPSSLRCLRIGQLDIINFLPQESNFCSAFLEEMCLNLAVFCLFIDEQCVDINPKQNIDLVMWRTLSMLPVENKAFCAALTEPDCIKASICSVYPLERRFVCTMYNHLLVGYSTISYIFGRDFCGKSTDCNENTCIRSNNGRCVSLFFHELEINEDIVSWEDIVNKCVQSDVAYCVNNGVNYINTVAFVNQLINLGNDWYIGSNYYISQTMCEYQSTTRCLNIQEIKVINYFPNETDFCSALLLDLCAYVPKYCYIVEKQCISIQPKAPLHIPDFEKFNQIIVTQTIQRRAFCSSLVESHCTVFYYCKMNSFNMAGVLVSKCIGDDAAISSYTSLPTIFGREHCSMLDSCSEPLCTLNNNTCQSMFLNTLQITEEFVSWEDLKSKCTTVGTKYCILNKLHIANVMDSAKDYLHSGVHWHISSNYFISQYLCEQDFFFLGNRCIEWRNMRIIKHVPTNWSYCSALLKIACDSLSTLCTYKDKQCVNRTPGILITGVNWEEKTAVILGIERKAFCAGLKENDCKTVTFCNYNDNTGINERSYICAAFNIDGLVHIFGKTFCSNMTVEDCKDDICVIIAGKCISLFLETMQLTSDEISWEDIELACQTSSNAIFCSNNKINDVKVAQYINKLQIEGNYWFTDDDYYTYQRYCVFNDADNASCAVSFYKKRIVKSSQTGYNFCSALLEISCSLVIKFCDFKKKKCYNNKVAEIEGTDFDLLIGVMTEIEYYGLCASMTISNCQILNICKVSYVLNNKYLCLPNTCFNINQESCEGKKECYWTGNTCLIKPRLADIFGETLCVGRFSDECIYPCIETFCGCTSVLLDSFRFPETKLPNLSWEDVQDACVHKGATNVCSNHHVIEIEVMKFVHDIYDAGNKWQIPENYFIAQKLCENYKLHPRCSDQQIEHNPTKIDFCSSLLYESCLLLLKYCILVEKQCLMSKSVDVINSSDFVELQLKLQGTERIAFCASFPHDNKCDDTLICRKHNNKCVFKPPSLALAN